MSESIVVSSLSIEHFLRVQKDVASNPSLMVNPSRDSDWTKENTLYACIKHDLVPGENPELAYMTARGWVFITARREDNKSMKADVSIVARTIGDADIVDVDQAVKAIADYFGAQSTMRRPPKVDFTQIDGDDTICA